MTRVNRIVVGIVLGVILVIGAAVGLLVFFTSGPDYSSLRKALKEKAGLDARSIELEGEKGQLQVGTLTTEQGETYPLVVHAGRSSNLYTGQVTATTQWIVGKQPLSAEEEIRKLVEQLGFEIASVDLRRNARGAGYVGEVATKSGEVVEIREELKGPPYVSVQKAELRPSSYDLWVRNTLEKELKEGLARLSDFVPKDKSWAMLEGERQARLRAEQAAKRERMKKEYEKWMEDIRRSGRQPTIGEIGAGQALIGPEMGLPIDPAEIVRRSVIGQGASQRSVVEYKSATATTTSGRVIEVETEAQTSPSRSISLSWRERKK